MAETKTTAAAPVEAAATYTAAELIAAAPAKFGVSQDVAAAALRMAGKKTATVEEVKAIITEFANREVK
jgi:hypothetical protein